MGLRRRTDPSVKDMTTITARPRRRRPPTVPSPRPTAAGACLRQLGVDTAYVLLGFPLGIITFVLVITGLSLGAGLLITLLGIPVLVATVFAARGFAEVERVRILPVCGSRGCGCGTRQAPAGPGCWRRMFTPLTDIQAWLDVLHAILRFPISRCRVLCRGHLVVGRARRPDLLLWDWALPHTADNHELPELLGLRRHPGQPDHLLPDHGRGRSRSPCRSWCAAAPCSRRGSPGPAHRRGRAARPGRRPDRGPGHRPGADRRRGLGRGDRAAPARARHPRRPAAAAGPARGGPRPGQAAARHRPGGGPRAPSTRRSRRPGRPSTSCARCPAASPRRSSPTAAWPRRAGRARRPGHGPGRAGHRRARTGWPAARPSRPPTSRSPRR